MFYWARILMAVVTRYVFLLADQIKTEIYKILSPCPHQFSGISLTLQLTSFVCWCGVNLALGIYSLIITPLSELSHKLLVIHKVLCMWESRNSSQSKRVVLETWGNIVSSSLLTSGFVVMVVYFKWGGSCHPPWNSIQRYGLGYPAPENSPQACRVSSLVVNVSASMFHSIL